MGHNVKIAKASVNQKPYFLISNHTSTEKSQVNQSCKILNQFQVPAALYIHIPCHPVSALHLLLREMFIG